MIFLPNKFECIVSALRNTIENLILKNGIKPNYLYMMMLILRAEALYYKNTEPVDLCEFTNEILTAVYIKKKGKNKKFCFYVENIGKCIINKKLYLCLIFLLCRESDSLAVKKTGGRITIKSYVKDITYVKNVITKLNGFYLRETKTNCLCVVLNPHKTNKKPLKTEKDWFDITNPLSMINCYLEE